MKNVLRKTGRFLFGKVLPAAAYPVISGPLKGARFVLGAMAGEGGGGSVYFNKVENEQTAAMLETVKAGDTVFDIGANVGYYAILASRLVGTKGVVIALEPLVRNLSFLQRHVELNKAENVRVMAFACSSENSIATFTTGENNAMGHLGAVAETHLGGASLLVPTVTLNELAERTGLMPNIIKIDVEGAEMDVLTGGREVLIEAKPVIFLSTHSPELRTSCLAYLAELGFDAEPLIAGDDPHEFIIRPR